GAGGGKPGVVGGGGSAGDEGLMDFVESGVGSRGEPGRKSPQPAPALARAANPAIDQQTENEILSEVRAFADEIVNSVELAFGEARPGQQRLEDAAGVFGGEGVGREGKDDGGPENGGPPGAEECGHGLRSGTGGWRLKGPLKTNGIE